MRIVLTFLLASTVCFATITRTQEKSNATGAKANPTTVTFTAGTQSGAFVVACIVGNLGAGATAAATNDKGDSATAWPPTQSSQNANLWNWCWYFKNPTAGSKTYTFTITNPGSISFLDAYIAEYAGVDNTTQPDVTITAGISTSFSTSCTTQTVSPATAGDLLVAMAQMGTTTGISGGSGTWTLVDNADGNGYADNLNGTTTASQSIKFTSSSGGTNICQIAAFKAASGSGGSPTMPPQVY